MISYVLCILVLFGEERIRVVGGCWKLDGVGC